MTNLQGDVIKILNASGSTVATYSYDAWGKILDSSGSMADINPIRYRGYYYDTDTQLYYLLSRYYDPQIARFINADSELAGILGDFRGYNLFAYCYNNPVNMKDSAGQWPEWVSGGLNILSGGAQMIAGAALGVFTSWTGVGAVVGGFLMINGAATVLQGAGQIVNDITDTDLMREDNIVKTGVESLGSVVGGETGEKVAGTAYDVAVVAANVYAGKVNLEGAMPKIVESKVFSINGGYGFKVGEHIEMFYRNPHAAGGLGGTL